MTQSSGSTSVSARFSALPELLTALSPQATGCHSAGDVQTLLRAQIAVEELFANSIHHGYGAESDQLVWLTVTHTGTSLHVTYADAADAFDPFESLKPLSEISECNLEERQIGGLGRYLVRDLATHVEHWRETGRNVTAMEFARSPIES